MIIDAHAHIDEVQALGWIDPPEKLVSLMDKAGIDKAVVATYANLPGFNPTAMEYVANAVNKYPERLIPYVRLDPWYGDRAIEVLVEAVEKFNFKGVKFHPVHYTLHPYGEQTVNIIKKAADYDIPVMFHCSDEEMSLPLQIELAVKKVPEAKVICAHLGGYFHNNDVVRMAATYENLYVDTCEFPYPKYIKKVVEQAGAEKVLFGTDLPTTNPFVEMEKIKLAGVTEEQEKMIFGGNIARILKL
ncbi:MAG: amidohydrolase family protein [Firmicutes bacterium]|nr:amidohydrolase family protein [Bacillota bacterium]